MKTLTVGSTREDGLPLLADTEQQIGFPKNPLTDLEEE